VQQGGSATCLQRNLKVDAKASDDPATAISQMTPLLQKICPDFDVDAKFGDVTAKTGTDCAKGKFGGVATGSQKVGCCCLCTLARAPNDWRIVVTIKDAPTTDDRKRQVNMIPTSGPSVPDIRYWTGGKPEKMAPMTQSEVLGHELCGHAALMQIKAHPPDEDENTSRTFSDVHDPTVKVENKVAAEMGRTTPRGLAASSAHRGESLRVFVVKPFAADDATISAAAQAVIDGAAKFSDVNEQKLIDVVGFSDASDKAAGISKKRADEVRANFDAKLTKKEDVPFTLSKGASETKIPRLQPAVDGGVGTVASVEIRLAREPAGLVNLPAGVTLPPTPTHVDPKNPEVVDLVTKKGKSTGNECHDLLIKTAWT
jgi:outer membrane protein OmpA-like peptidoglycan-associated protein